MTLSWDSVAIKYLLFIFNLLFVITGIVFIAVGVSIKAYYVEYEAFLDDNYFSTPNLFIAIGSLIFIIAFFGCCGAIKENFCMVITFSTLLILIFILELAAGISGYVLRNSTGDMLDKALTESLSKYGEKDANVMRTWDLVQQTFQCCGVHGPSDWKSANAANSTDNLYPLSCCTIPAGAIGNFSCIEEAGKALHTIGCEQAFGNYVRDHAYTIGAVGITFSLVQALGIIFSCRLSSQIRQNYANM